MSFPSPVPDTWSVPPGMPTRRTRSVKPNGKTLIIEEKHSPGLMTADEAKQWMVAQTPRKNMAGQKDVHDRAVAWAKSIRAEYAARTAGIRKLWKVLDLIMQGESMAQVGDIEIVGSNELLKAIERLVPRIEEVLQRDEPWFRPRATLPEFQDHEQDILGYMLQQHRNDGISQLWQPLIRNMLLYQAAVAKVRWERKIERRVETQIIETNDDISTRYEIKKEEMEALVFDGPRFTIVDPYSFIIDPDCISARDAQYIGDSRSRRLDELLYMQSINEYVNVDDVAENLKAATEASELGGFDAMVASLTKPAAMARIQHGPKFVDCLEVWGAFDIHGNNRPVECQVVVANGATCVLARENPLERNIRPYAVGRTAKWAKEFFNVGVMDVAARVQDHLDVLRTITQHSTLLGMSPIVFTERSDVGLPQSIMSIAPGTVIPGGGRIQMVTPQSDTRAHLPLHVRYQADIGELTGAPDNLSGTADTNTATESVKNLDQANKRVAGLIRSYADLLNQVFTIQHHLNRQFTCTKVAWAAMGKSAEVLMRHYGFVTPATFLGDVEFEFDGLASVFQQQTRAQGQAEWMRQWGPMLPAVADQVNIAALMQQSYADLVGDPGRKVFRVSPMPQDLAPQSAENKGLLAGREIAVNDLDPHPEHLRDMGPLIKLVRDGKITNARVLQAIAKHYLGHLDAMERVRNQEAVRSTLRQRQQPPPEPDQGNGASESSGTNELAVSQTPRGETPGAGSPQQMANPGRNQPTPQAQQ